MRIARPSADVDDVQRLVQKGEQGSELREGKGILQMERVGRKRAWRGQSGESEIDVLCYE